MVAAGAPALMILGLAYLGIASVLPFAAGLFGFSRRAAYIFAALFICGLIVLEGLTLSHQLRYQGFLRILFNDVLVAGVLALELLVAFVLAYWLGSTLRTLFGWVGRRLRLITGSRSAG